MFAGIGAGVKDIAAQAIHRALAGDQKTADNELPIVFGSACNQADNAQPSNCNIVIARGLYLRLKLGY